MPYYRGDYYKGDGGNYYRGDPFIGGLVAGAVGKLAGKAAAAVGRAVGRGGRQIVRDLAPSSAAGAIGVALGQRMGPGTGVVKYVPQKKYRRMNPLNPRALKRALRRAEGFEKFAKDTINGLYRVIDGRRVRTFKKRKES